MWLLYNFVLEFKDTFHRKLDQEFAPNSGTDLAEDVKTWMDEPFYLKEDRQNKIIALQKLQQSLQELDNVTRGTQSGSPTRLY
jgi:hypothetical protein